MPAWRSRAPQQSQSTGYASLCAAAQTALFAGRRATDRGFLLLQNLFCQRHLPGYAGTSSVYAVTLLERAMRAEGVPAPERKRAVGARSLRGCTHMLTVALRY